MFYLCYFYLFMYTGVQHDVHINCCSCISNTAGATSGAVTVCPSGSSDFTHGFCRICAARSFVFCLMFCRSLIFLLSIVLCDLSSPTYSLWLVLLVSSNFCHHVFHRPHLKKICVSHLSNPVLLVTYWYHTILHTSDASFVFRSVLLLFVCINIDPLLLNITSLVYSVFVKN